MGGPPTETRSLRLPSQDSDHESAAARARGPFSWLLIGLNAIGVGLVMLVYLVISPFVALGTGLLQVGMETRDTLKRPRPFVGTKHGLPFLDPPTPPPAPAPEPEPEDA